MKFQLCNHLNKLPVSADLLFELASHKSMFFSRPWFENLNLEHLEEVQSTCFACVVDGEQVLAILPLMRRSGNSLHALRHRYSSLCGLLIGPDNRDAIMTCLTQGLATLGIDGLLLEPIPQQDSVMEHLEQAMAKAGFTAHRSFRFYNWVLKVGSRSFEEYMASRPSKLRNTVARKSRKLGREHEFELRLFSGTNAAEGLADYHAVYGSSWKALEQYGDFLDGLVSAFSAKEWTRIAVLYIDGKPAAAQLWFVVQGKASIFRLAYDETWKQYSPGSILTAFLMEQVIDRDKVTEVDFLTGNEGYKQDWMSERRERWAISFANTNPRSSGVFDGLMKTVKQIFKSNT